MWWSRWSWWWQWWGGFWLDNYEKWMIQNFEHVNFVRHTSYWSRSKWFYHLLKFWTSCNPVFPILVLLTLKSSWSRLVISGFFLLCCGTEALGVCLIIPWTKPIFLVCYSYELKLINFNLLTVWVLLPCKLVLELVMFNECNNKCWLSKLWWMSS